MQLVLNIQIDKLKYMLYRKSKILYNIGDKKIENITDNHGE